MCIECRKAEHYVPSGDMFMLQVDTVNTEEKKYGSDANGNDDRMDTIPKLDSDRESGDSGTVANTVTEIVSSSQACNDVSDCKRGQKAADCKKRPSLHWIAVLLVMWCIAVLKASQL